MKRTLMAGRQPHAYQSDGVGEGGRSMSTSGKYIRFQRRRAEVIGYHGSMHGAFAVPTSGSPMRQHTRARSIATRRYVQETKSAKNSTPL